MFKELNEQPIKTKENIISLSGPLEDLIIVDVPIYSKQIIRRDIYNFDMQEIKRKNIIEASQIKSNPTIILNSKSWYTRADLEKKLNKSRSTITRLIGNWIKDSHIIKEGKYKNARYQLSDHLVAQLSKGVILKKK